ncbi:tRNA (guanosine(46)-N7)-methyltransferase TrmB [soil metagenome]
MSRTKRLPREQLDPYLIEFTPEMGIVDLATVFQNNHPIEIEVGCGKGLFLLRSALAQPETNFLGIELDRKYQMFVATRIAKRSLRNVRMAGADARIILAERLPSESCSLIHAYFPDPWWKTKHRKRRLFTPEFVKACQRVLRPGGVLSIATDVAEYFQVIVQMIATETALVAKPMPQPEQASSENFSTNFELKALLKGTVINRALYEKPLSSGGIQTGPAASTQSPQPSCNEPLQGEESPRVTPGSGFLTD